MMQQAETLPLHIAKTLSNSIPQYHHYHPSLVDETDKHNITEEQQYNTAWTPSSPSSTTLSSTSTNKCIELSTCTDSHTYQQQQPSSSSSDEFTLQNTSKSLSTPYYGGVLIASNLTTSKDISSQTKHVFGNVFDWMVDAVVWPLLNWTSIPLLVYFILMTYFQPIAFGMLFGSEGEFFNTVDFNIVASIDKMLTFGSGMPHEILANLYHPFLDVFFAIPYLAHFVYPLALYPIIVCIFLWTPNRETLKETVLVPSYHLMKSVITGRTHSSSSEEQDNEIVSSSYNGSSTISESNSNGKSSKVSNYKLKCYLLSLGLISFIQVILCYFFPTAPPWFRDNTIKYEEYYNLIGDATLDMSPPALPLFAPEARFEMVDRLIGFELFAGIYGKGTIKFGSFYSLHVGWTAIMTFMELFVVYNGYERIVDQESLQVVEQKKKWTFYQIFMIQYLVWIFLASMYSAHHYMIDGIVAVILAVIITKLSTMIIRNDTKHNDVK